MSRGPYRRHSPQFKLQLCSDIRAGTIGRKEAQRKYTLSANLVQLWLTQYDRGELDAEEVEATLVTEYEAKIAALERKVGQLTMELDLLKKSTAPASRDRQRDAVNRYRSAGCSVRRGCQVIGLPRSSFYYRSSATAAGLPDEQLVKIIDEIQDEFPGYGYRRVTCELVRRGHVVTHKRVARVMKAAEQGVKPRRRFVRTTDSDHDLPVFPNLYRNVIPAKPNTVWVGDITYIRIGVGFCYLAAILDACSRKVVGASWNVMEGGSGYLGSPVWAR